MPANMEFTGFDDLQNQLNNIQEKISDNVDGLVSFDELFPKSFMNENTQFSSFNELLEAGGYSVNSQEDFDAIPSDAIDQHISSTTKFNSWEEMQQCAGTDYVKRKLGL